MNSSTATAVATLAGLLDAGVRDVVLAPGSRSAALAVTLSQAADEDLLRMHVRIDERTAAFLALGLAKASHRPVAVVTTSGTAVANLHPALLEALHAGVPLVAVTADRPAGLRGTGANQTTEQPGLFGPQIHWVDVAPADTAAARSGIDSWAGTAGPLHLNLQFGEPLLPDTLPVDLGSARDGSRRADPPSRHRRDADVDADASDGPEELPAGPATVLVAGDDAGPAARLLAERAGWPLLAEPTSGARTGTNAIRTYRLLLSTSLGAAIERVVVAGHPTLSRPVTALLSRADLEVLAVAGRGGVATDPGRVARHLPQLPTVTGPGPAEWLSAWRRADAATSRRLDRLVTTDASAAPLRLAGQVAAAVPPGGLLVVGSSQPVRDLDLMAAPYPPGQRRLIIGNRGLAGIDGTLSTAIGAALGRRSSRALAYVGDLTFLHDLTGLVIGPREPVPDLTVVVANDDGGSIFSTLEPGRPSYAVAFERVFGTPHGVDLTAICAATGTAHYRADTPDDLGALLAQEPRGIRVVEVPLDRSGRRQLAERLAVLAPE